MLNSISLAAMADRFTVSYFSESKNLFVFKINNIKINLTPCQPFKLP